MLKVAGNEFIWHTPLTQLKDLLYLLPPSPSPLLALKKKKSLSASFQMCFEYGSGTFYV